MTTQNSHSKNDIPHKRWLVLPWATGCHGGQGWALCWFVEPGGPWKDHCRGIKLTTLWKIKDGKFVSNLNGFLKHPLKPPLNLRDSCGGPAHPSQKDSDPHTDGHFLLSDSWRITHGGDSVTPYYCRGPRGDTMGWVESGRWSPVLLSISSCPC